jgi:ABC-type transporter Mla maintaining outer membrane lipid asymmetry ATPase subunit MlaF
LTRVIVPGFLSGLIMLPALAVIAGKSGLHKAFGKKEVLRGLDLEVGQGESRVIIGGSGSGKSVILKRIIGIMKPDSGSVFIEDVDITGLKGGKLYEIREKIGMLFQMPALFDSMKVWENVDNILNANMRGAYVGGGVRFADDDRKHFFSSAAAAK